MAASFSRRHYEALAGVLQLVAVDIIQARLTEADETWRAVRDELVELLAEDNPRFNRDRFYAAIVPQPPLTNGDDDA